MSITFYLYIYFLLGVAIIKVRLFNEKEREIKVYTGALSAKAV